MTVLPGRLAAAHQVALRRRASSGAAQGAGILRLATDHVRRCSAGCAACIAAASILRQLAESPAARPRDPRSPEALGSALCPLCRLMAAGCVRTLWSRQYCRARSCPAGVCDCLACS